jgi:hypothetical protein
LLNDDRNVFGLNMDPFLADHGQNVGAIGQFSAEKPDTWIMIPEIEAHMSQDIFSGHAVIITGYDDNACVEDQCGLCTIRNSVGADLGEHGDFYVSYSDFKKLASGSAFAIGPKENL